MISIEEALTAIANQQVVCKSSEKPLSESGGFYLAESIRAPFDLPDFDNSAMDGYAISGFADSYEIIGEVAAGDTSGQLLKEGKAMRIFTGGKVPEGTTAVVMQEKTEVTNSSLRVQTTVTPGQHIRVKGSELSENQEVFAPGHFISPATVGLIGSLGIERIKVFQKPTIRLITTGNELITPGRVRKAGQIYESNSFAITAALKRYGYTCDEKNQIADNYDEIRSGIQVFLDKSDVLLLSGGISVGDYDYVKQALVENGVEEIFYKVFQKPGKPLFFGKKDQKYVFALPGNPASSLTCFYVYVLPLLQKLSGAGQTDLMRCRIPLAHDFKLKGDRPAFLKAHIADQQVSILDGQSSSMIHSMALGNALAKVDGGAALKTGDLIACILL